MRTRLAILSWVVLAVLLATSARAETTLSDPALERRARALMQEIRCVVCQSQSIGESDAMIAADMRRLIRERIEAGDSDRQILDYLASRYGDFVLFRPPFRIETLVLWLGPFAALALGAGFVFLRRKNQRAPAGDLDETERRRVAELLEHGIGPRDAPRDAPWDGPKP